MLRYAPSVCRLNPQRLLSTATSKGFYVLTPELPSDTPETNSLLRLDGLPEFPKISEDKVVTGCAKLAMEYEVEFGAITDRLNAGDSNFGTIFGAIESYLAPLSNALRLVEHLKNIDQRYQGAFWRVARQGMKAKSNRWGTDTLFKAVRSNLQTNQHLSSIEKRLCEHYVYQCKRAGLDMNENSFQSLLALEQSIEKEQELFQICAIDTQNLYEQVLDQASMFGKAPSSLFYKTTLNPSDPLKGPWKITIHPDIYYEFMKYCPDTSLRWSAWHAWVNRASNKHSGNNRSNHKRIGTIQHHALDRAKLFNASSAADLETQTSMAGSVKNVKSFLEKSCEKIKPLAVQEAKSLKSYSMGKDLNAWDIPYWRQQMYDGLYGTVLESEEHLIPLEASLSNVFMLTEALFGIQFERLPPQTAQPWHPSVSVYRVVDVDSGRRVLGYVYLDLFARPETGKCVGSWVSLGREPSALLGCSPLSFIVMNMPKPLAGQPAFISPQNLFELVRLIGSSLPHMLCHNQFSEISAGLLVEQDFSTVMGNFLQFMVSDHPAILSNVCPTLSDKQLKAVSKATYHMAASDNAFQLFMSSFDLDLHSSDKYHWMEFLKSNWDRYLKDVMPHHEKDDHSPCGLVQIFCAPHFGMYYSLKWSEYVARDLITSFNVKVPTDSNDDPVWTSAEFKENGRRLRRSILEPGCLFNANDAFRRARGRDFSVDSALDQLTGVIKASF